MSLILLVYMSGLISEGKAQVNANVTFNPPNNTTVTRRVGDENITFECEIFVDNVQQLTLWNIEKFNGISGAVDITSALGGFTTVVFDGTPRNSGIIDIFRNILIIREFVAEFDGSTLLCDGNGQQIRTAGRFPLRVYREPFLQTFTEPIRYPEGHTDLIVTLEERHPDQLLLTSFEWSLNGVAQRNDSRRMFGYPYMTIITVQHSDAGNYSLTLTNLLPGNPPLEVVGAVGSFILDVVYGPDLVAGPAEQAVRLGDPLSLVCGTVESNPEPTVTWMSPRGEDVPDNTTKQLIVRHNGTRKIRLILYSNMSVTIDNVGLWTCIVRVEGVNITTVIGTVESSFVREETAMLLLVIVAAPGRPGDLTVLSIGSSWADLVWQEPVEYGQPAEIVRYIITANSSIDNTTVLTLTTSTTSNTTRFNMTNLLPHTLYEFRVQAVAGALGVEDVGVTSVPALETTIINDLTEITESVDISCSSATFPTSFTTALLTAIITALLATLISIVVHFAVCKCHPKFRSSEGAQTVTSAGRDQGPEYEVVGEGQREENAFALKANEAYATCP